MCALRWKHVDFERRRLTIARGIVEAGGELIEKDTKTHQVRTVSLDEETTAILPRTPRSLRRAGRAVRHRPVTHFVSVLARGRLLEAVASRLRDSRLRSAAR
jgi:integrase